MKARFSQTGMGTARYVGMKRLLAVDISYPSFDSIGGRKRRNNLLLKNIEFLADYFSQNHQLPKSEFYKAAKDYGLPYKLNYLESEMGL